MVGHRRVAVLAVFALALAGVGCSGGGGRSKAEVTTTNTTAPAIIDPPLTTAPVTTAPVTIASTATAAASSTSTTTISPTTTAPSTSTPQAMPVWVPLPSSASPSGPFCCGEEPSGDESPPLEDIGKAVFPGGTYAFGSTWTPDRPDMLVLHISRYVRAPCATVGFDPFGEIEPGTCPEDQLTTGESMDLSVPLDENISVSLFSLVPSRYECPSTPHDVFLPDTTVLIGTGVNLSRLLTELERDIDTWLRQPFAESQDLEAVLASYQGLEDTAFAVPPVATCQGQTVDEMSWGGVPGREAIWRGANGVNLLVQDVGQLMESGATKALSPTGLSTDYDGRISLHFYTGYSP